MARLDLGPPLAALKAAAAKEIDAQAERARGRFLTPGAGQALEYQATEAEARRFMATLAAGGTPDIADGSFPFLKAELDATGNSGGGWPPGAAIAAAVAAQADAWNAVGSRIKELRRTAKLLVDAATTPAQVRQAAADIQWPSPSGG